MGVGVGGMGEAAGAGVAAGPHPVNPMSKMLVSNKKDRERFMVVLLLGWFAL